MKPSQNPWRVWAVLVGEGMAEVLFNAFPRASGGLIALHMEIHAENLATYLRDKKAPAGVIAQALATYRTAYAARWAKLAAADRKK